MDRRALHETIKNLLKFGLFRPSKHCKERMAQRGVQIDDVLNVVLWGKISKIEKGRCENEFKCTILGNDLDGEALTFVAIVDIDGKTISCATVF